jgi:hypothetical protein
MEKAIITLSKLGFMLRNLDFEFESRFTDELLLFDKQAKVLGSPKTVSRAKLGPVIGLGSSQLTKYSMAGRVSLLISVLFQESILEISRTEYPNIESFVCLLTWPGFYKKLDLFPQEFSALRLVLIAKETFQKFDSDYRIASFCNLLEW